MIGARLPRDLRLGGRAYRRDDGGLALLGELDGVMTHRSGGSGHQHGRTFLDAGEADGVISGIGGNAEARRGFHGDAGGERRGLLRRQHDRSGSGAERAPPLAVPDPDALAQPRRRRAVADAINLSCAVAVRDHPRERDLARRAGAALDVGGIDAGGEEAHPHLAAPRLGGLDLSHAQNRAGGSVRLVIGSAHGMMPRPWRPPGGLAVTFGHLDRNRKPWGSATPGAPAEHPPSDQLRGFTRPGSTSNTADRAAMSANAAASAPVIQACAPSVSSSP